MTEIRLARAEDLPSAGALTVEAYTARGLLGDAESGYAARLADTASRASEAELYVAVDDGLLLGCVTFCPYGSPWGEIAEPGEGEFRMLAVDPAHGSRGVGLALAEHCLQRSRALGYGAVVLSTLPTMTTAHRLYERLGFVRLPERDWEPAPGVDLLAYRLVL